MKAVTVSWKFAFLCTITASLQIKPKTISLDSLKRIEDMTETARGSGIGFAKWHYKRKRIQDDNHSRKQQREREEALRLDMMFCQPYPSVVQMPEPSDWRSFYMPSFVKLHRCSGGCSLSPRIGYCAVAKEEKISVAVRLGEKATQVVMSNHTACVCACLPKKCPFWQRFDDDFCDCVCIDDGKAECNKNKIKRWDRNLCQCVCSIQALNCDFGFKWSEESCKCEVGENSVDGIAASEGRL